jgi:hypothetical protein
MVAFRCSRRTGRRCPRRASGRNPDGIWCIRQHRPPGRNRIAAAVLADSHRDSGVRRSCGSLEDGSRSLAHSVCYPGSNLTLYHNAYRLLDAATKSFPFIRIPKVVSSFFSPSAPSRYSAAGPGANFRRPPAVAGPRRYPRGSGSPGPRERESAALLAAGRQIALPGIHCTARRKIPGDAPPE